MTWILRDLLSSRDRVLVEAHRGGNRDARGNSIESLNAALEGGADLIEVDVQLTKDGVAFLYHDHMIEGAWVSELLWSDICALYEPAAPVPLDEALAWAKRNGAFISLDVKEGFGRSFLEEVAGVADEAGVTEQVFLMSWDHQSLLEIKKRYPAFATRAHVRARLVDLELVVRAAAVDAVTLAYDLTCRDHVKKLKDMNVFVALAEMWQPDFAFVQDLGVDIVSWDRPAEARRELALLDSRS